MNFKKVSNQIMLITYADSMGKNLKELEEILTTQVKGAIGGLHILPFFPSSADRGFAPMTYREVDPAFGDWEDIERLASKYYLMYDYMINHVSAHSPEYLDYLEKKDESEYRDFFIRFQDFWENGYPTQEQLEKKAAKVIEGEALDIIVGNKPLTFSEEEKEKKGESAGKDAVKKGILHILKENYDMDEEDFISAELEVVPAGKAREAGFDRSMILSYGQDDRVCAFTSLKAMLEMKSVERTACCLLVDKEEIGSVGATGMQSHFFENMVAEVLNLMGEYSELNVRRCLASSCMLSSDVSSAFDPTYAASFDKKNVAYLGGGMVFNKFTGARGKSGSNDANAEYLAHIRNIFEKENIHFQTAELGRVDLGGGGTIAYILALYGMNVIDSGVAVLNMHAPREAVSKADVYETKRGYVAFLKGAAI